MTFEEFFKKKRIDLTALDAGESSLFIELKNHFEQMGEKSFDYTKKYWFNKLRRQFPLAIELKTEKPHIANPLAEQTITESLTEAVTPLPSPKLGFVPKFKAGNMPKPAVSPDEKNDERSGAPVIESTESPSETAAAPPSPKLGFVPKFKAGNMPKPAVSANEKKDEPLSAPAVENAPAEEPAESRPAYKPTFNMKNIPPKESEK